MASTTNSKKSKNYTNNKNSNTKKISTSKIVSKKVSTEKEKKVEVEEISIEDALKSRVKRNQNLYTKHSNVNEVKDEQMSVTKQQKFNFESNKVEDEMDTSFKDTKTKKKKSEVKASDIKVEDIPLKKALRTKKDEQMTITVLFLTVVIVFMGVFLIYHFSSFDHDKVKVVTKTKEVEVPPENIVFLGDSITEQYNLDKNFPDRKTVNSGISGNKTRDILDDMKGRVYRYNPSHVFLLIGTNDLNNDISNEEIVNNIKEIVKDIKENLPKTKIYLESIYPINNTDDDKVKHWMVGDRENSDIKEINNNLKKFAKEEKIKYINLYDKLINKDGDLNLDYSKEGLHMNDAGYDVITWEINKILKKS